MLLVRAELADLFDNRFQQGLGRLIPMALEGVNQPLLAEFLARFVERFGDAIGVERQRIAGEEMAFSNGAIPILEEHPTTVAVEPRRSREPSARRSRAARCPQLA